MYFSGCLLKSNTKVAFILIFKVAALTAYDFSTLVLTPRGSVVLCPERSGRQGCAVLPALRPRAPRSALRVPVRDGARGGVHRTVVRRL